MFNVFLAGMGGFIGSALRYLLNLWIYRFFDYPVFPYGTLIINVSGCLTIGFLSGLVDTRQLFTPEVRVFIFIGVLGGFTTFSSFGYDTFGLFRNGQTMLAGVNVLLQMILGLSAVWLGYNLSKIF
jgi:fluoride exporter